MYRFKQFKNKINEGLIKTYSKDQSKDLIDRVLSNTDHNYDIIPTDKDTIIIKLYDKSVHKLVIQYMNNLGWFPSSLLITNNKMTKRFKYLEELLKYDIIEITFESKFDKKVEDFYPILYHVTIKNKVDKILKYGLSPKSNNKLSKHPDRIYLTIDYNEILTSFEIVDKLNMVSDKEYTVLQIDNSENEINMYIDPNSNGFYTYENIRPNTIKVVL